MQHSRWFFLAFFGLSLIVFGLLLKLFWISMGLAVVITVTCSPIYRLSLKWFKYRYLAATLATLVVFLLLVVPLGSMMGVLVTQVLKFSQQFSGQLQNGALATSIDQLNQWLVSFVGQYVDMGTMDINLRAGLIEFARSTGHMLYQYSPRVLNSTIHIMLNTVLCLFFTFVFFADGGALYDMIVAALPISLAHEEEINREVQQMVRATLTGMIATAIVNGFLIGLAFWVTGLPKPVMWGIVAIGFSLIPVFGAFIIWGGGSLVLLLQGNLHYAIGLVLYGLLIISQVDNVVKPWVMGNRVNLHPALLLISLLGGMSLFGPSGLVFGPVMLSVIVATFRIYQKEFSPVRT